MTSLRHWFAFLLPFMVITPATADPVYSQQAFLKGSNTEEMDFYGHAVAISGNLAAVGAIREDSVGTGYNAPKDDSEGPTDKGAVYLYTRQGITWTETGFLKASNANLFPLNGVHFGSALAISGNTLVVGARGEESNATGVNGNQANQMAGASGAAFVFVLQNGVWVQQAYLKASNTGFNDFFGSSVAISGNIIVVGAPGEDGSSPGVNGSDNNGANESGAAYVYERTGSTWSFVAYLKAPQVNNDDQFGAYVAISGQTIVVGAGYEDGSARTINGTVDEAAENGGAAYVFVKNGATWEQQAYLKSFNLDAGDRFGTSVAIAGDRILVGAPFENGNSTTVNGPDNNDSSFVGAVYEFTRSGDTWSPGDYLKPEVAQTWAVFGHSLALEGDQCVIGAKSNSSGATGVNGDQSDTTQFNSGAAYRFVRSGGVWAQAQFFKPSNTHLQNEFGESVAISGRSVLVGCPLDDAESQAVNGDDTQNIDNNYNAGSAFLFHLPSPARLRLSSAPRFPAVKVGRRSPKRTLTLTNIGEENLRILRLRVSGSGRGDFLVQAPSSRLLQPAENTVSRVTFRPRRSGIRRAKLTVQTDVVPGSLNLLGRAK